MKASLLTKLETLTDRHEEVSALLGDSETIADQNRFRDLSREFAQLEPVIALFGRYEQIRADQAAAEEMLSDDDPVYVNLVFCQAQDALVSGDIVCGLEQGVQLVATQFQV